MSNAKDEAISYLTVLLRNDPSRADSFVAFLQRGCPGTCDVRVCPLASSVQGHLMRLNLNCDQMNRKETNRATGIVAEIVRTALQNYNLDQQKDLVIPHYGGNERIDALEKLKTNTCFAPLCDQTICPLAPVTSSYDSCKAIYCPNRSDNRGSMIGDNNVRYKLAQAIAGHVELNSDLSVKQYVGKPLGGDPLKYVIDGIPQPWRANDGSPIWTDYIKPIDIKCNYGTALEQQAIDNISIE